METTFGASAPYTVGVEEEFQLANAQSFGPTPVIDAVLARLSNLLPDFVRFTCNRYFSFAAYLHVPEVSMLPQVLAGDINPPVFVSSHNPDASTRRLVLRALLDNDGTREVHFERMAAG